MHREQLLDKLKFIFFLLPSRKMLNQFYICLDMAAQYNNRLFLYRQILYLQHHLYLY